MVSRQSYCIKVHRTETASIQAANTFDGSINFRLEWEQRFAFEACGGLIWRDVNTQTYDDVPDVGLSF